MPSLANRTTSVYDNAGRTVASIDALGNRSTTLYDAASQVTAAVDPLSHRTSFAYDEAGRQIDVENPLGNRSTSVYDAAGQVAASINPHAGPVHSVLLAADVPIVEHLTNLAELPDEGSRFFAVPVKVKAFGTFPVRAFANVTVRH